MREVIDNTDRSRYELHVDGELVGLVDYRRREEHIAFTHAEVDGSREGEGHGSHLARHVLDAAADAGLAVHPLCPFIADYVERHEDEYGHLVPDSHRG